VASHNRLVSRRRSRVTSESVPNGPNDEPSRIGLQQIVAGALLAILVVGGVAFYINRPSQKVEHLSQLVRQVRPWCSQHHFGDVQIDTSHTSLAALAQSNAPRWEVSSDSGVVTCSQNSQPGTTLFVLTFATSNDENLWLSKDNTGLYQIIGDNFPLPVWVGLGWVAVLGSNSNRENAQIASLKTVLKVDYRFSQFSTVSW
jgi:hypothetical protein